MKYELVVDPGVDPDVIRLRYRGASSVELGEDGQLVIDSPAGGFEDARPYAYQEVDDLEHEVTVRYALGERGEDGSVEYGFALGGYDRSRPLILDPSLVMYCGYIGGVHTDDARGIAVDGEGCAYVVGGTFSDESSFPVTVGPDLTINDMNFGDAFIAKVEADGSGLVYCGYIGGNDREIGNCVAVDDYGIAYVAGYTYSTNFPVAGAGPGSTFAGGPGDGFVTAVSANGTGLVYSGYIGGEEGDWIEGIAVASHPYSGGYAHVVGTANSDESTFPVQTGPDMTHNGGADAFVAKLFTNGAKQYCGYIGGSEDDAGMDVAVGISGIAHVTGFTLSTEASFPVTWGPDLTHNGDFDAFVAVVHGAGMWLTACGYIGGSGDDRGYGIALGVIGFQEYTFITGGTTSDESTFPVVGGPDLTYNGGSGMPYALGDAFVARADSDLLGLTYCGYLGGEEDDYGRSIAVDDSGRAFVTGATSSSEVTFPVVNGPDLTYGGSQDGFVAKLEPMGGGMYYCGYIGGVSIDSCYGIALDGDGAAFVTGVTKSGPGSFPVTPNSLDETYNGGWDAYVAKVIDPTMLWCDVYTLVESTGGTVNFTLDAGIANQHRTYILAGSISGTEPGIPLPGGLVTLPLNWDGFTDVILQWLNTNTFKDFWGFLDQNGQATPQLNVGPVPPAYVGIPIWFAFALSNPYDVVSHPIYIYVVN